MCLTDLGSFSVSPLHICLISYEIRTWCVVRQGGVPGTGIIGTRGRKYVIETLKLLPELPDSFFIDQVVAHMAELGRVNHAVNPA